MTTEGKRLCNPLNVLDNRFLYTNFTIPLWQKLTSVSEQNPSTNNRGLSLCDNEKFLDNIYKYIYKYNGEPLKISKKVLQIWKTKSVVQRVGIVKSLSKQKGHYSSLIQYFRCLYFPQTKMNDWKLDINLHKFISILHPHLSQDMEVDVRLTTGCVLSTL